MDGGLTLRIYYGRTKFNFKTLIHKRLYWRINIIKSIECRKSSRNAKDLLETFCIVRFLLIIHSAVSCSNNKIRKILWKLAVKFKESKRSQQSFDWLIQNFTTFLLLLLISVYNAGHCFQIKVCIHYLEYVRFLESLHIRSPKNIKTLPNNRGLLLNPP